MTSVGHFRAAPQKEIGDYRLWGQFSYDACMHISEMKNVYGVRQHQQQLFHLQVTNHTLTYISFRWVFFEATGKTFGLCK